MSGEQIALFETEGASAPAPLPEPKAQGTRTIEVEVVKGMCTYSFKGCACQYEGAASSCDKTLASCEALGNTDRFPKHLRKTKTIQTSEKPIWYPEPTHIKPTDPQVRDSVQEPRLSAQSVAILERLKIGPATNKELAGIALNYRARISDLRAAGYVIELADYKDETGAGLYELRRRA